MVKSIAMLKTKFNGKKNAMWNIESKNKIKWNVKTKCKWNFSVTMNQVTMVKENAMVK